MTYHVPVQCVEKTVTEYIVSISCGSQQELDEILSECEGTPSSIFEYGEVVSEKVEEVLETYDTTIFKNEITKEEK